MKQAPGPRAWPLVGHLFQFISRPPQFQLELSQRYGDVVRFYLGTQANYLINDPALIKEVLVGQSRKFMKGNSLQAAKRIVGEGLLTSEGEAHLRQRRMLQPVFHRQKMAAFGPIMSDFAHRAESRWRDGEHRDLSEEMRHITLGIITKTLFSADIETTGKNFGEDLDHVLRMVAMFTLPGFRYVENLPFPVTRNFRRARENLQTTLLGIIQERRMSGKKIPDLLGLLLSAQDDDGHGGMNDQQLYDEVMTLFLAGHETTMTALSWAWYLLALHPEWEERLLRELSSVVGARTASAEDMPQLKEMRAFLTETMRIYPPVWNIVRKAKEDFQAGEYLVPAGSLVVMSPYVTQRTARFFPRPEAFDPHRWLNEETRIPFTYFPFGGGARVCIGEGFAWMEMMLVMAAILPKWKFHLEGKGELGTEALITLRPKGGVPVRLEARRGR